VLRTSGAASKLGSRDPTLESKIKGRVKISKSPLQSCRFLEQLAPLSYVTSTALQQDLCTAFAMANFVNSTLLQLP